MGENDRSKRLIYSESHTCYGCPATMTDVGHESEKAHEDGVQKEDRTATLALVVVIQSQ